MGGPRLLLGEQVVFGHRAPPGRPVQERDQPALPAQPRPEESHLELHSVRDRNKVSRCLSHTRIPFLSFSPLEAVGLSTFAFAGTTTTTTGR